MVVPASPDAQLSRRRRNRLLAVILAIVVIILIIVAALASSSSSSGLVKLSDITIKWNGATYTLLDIAYASKSGDKGFNFDAEFQDSGTCYSTTACFDPGSSSFSISSLTSGFQVVWVTTCYQSLGYPALVGPIYGPYSSKPPVIPSGCLSGGTDVDMSGVTPNTSVYLTVDIEFTSSAAFTGTLSLQANPVTTGITTTGAGDATALALTCSPGVVALGAVTPCTATVNDTATAPKATGAPTGYVNFTAPSGSFGPGPSPSCQLQPSDTGTNSSSSCTVNYLTASLGTTLVFASYGGDSGHASSTAGFGVETFEYTLSVTPTSQSVAQGNGASFTVTATLEPQSVTQDLPNATLAVQFCNTGSMTCTFSQAYLVPGGTPITLTITPITGSVQVPYTYSFSVTGTTGSGDYVFTVTSNTVSLDVT